MIAETDRCRSALVAVTAGMTARLVVLVVAARLSGAAVVALCGCLPWCIVAPLPPVMAGAVMAGMVAAGTVMASPVGAGTVAAAVSSLLQPFPARLVTPALAPFASLRKRATFMLAIVTDFGLDVWLLAGRDRSLAAHRRILVPATRPLALAFGVLVYGLGAHGDRLRRFRVRHVSMVRARGILRTVALATAGVPFTPGVAIAAARAPFRPTT